MLIDCDGCVVRGAACRDCVVSAVLGAPPAGLEIDESECRAFAVLADAGMVPRLRLITERDVSGRADGPPPLPGTGDPAPPAAPRRRRSRHVA
jgi:hypothetical protein